ncbi:hypothetical protein Val02_68660 [Virgisporangium aliadipatigenens]|uniref:Uncharacterized protein n=1 Tax=Virgisporangium aliadipatigenens TaxID=741659 RepID=A0A8J3YUA4_9ACTN|nr:hypothetical protein [Virgisporangium aliadipatigenens]GIJ49980.1 hypothetical protein Val02_68660 [Virgisporangium aliadipatigenens]
MSEILAASSVDVQGGLSDMLRTILLFLPKALLFVLILVVGYIVAKVLLKVVDKVLERVGFDRVVERGGIRAALAHSKYDASDIVAKLVYYAVLLFTLQLAFGVWGPNPVSDLLNDVIAWLPNAFVAIVIVVIAAAIGAAVKDMISGALGGLSYGRILANVASWFIVGLGVIAALNQIGVATTVTMPVLIAVLATVAGILIVGVGGGLVKPMQSRWEGMLERARTESQTIAEHAKAYSAGQRDMEEAMAGQVYAGAATPAPASVRTSFDQEPVQPGTTPVATPASTAPATPATSATPATEATGTARRSGAAATPDVPPQAAPPPRGWPVSEQPTQVIPQTPPAQQ